MYFINFKNLFTFLCSILTLCLISQVLFTYVVKKPTSTTKEEKELENTDLPEVVVCIDPPGLNSTSLERNGYHISTYWRGVLHPMQRSEKFVGWNGRGGENKSSHDILEEALLLPESFNKTKLISYSGYSENYEDFKESKVTQMKIAFPSGRCWIIDPPSQKTGTPLKLLHIDFSEAAFKKLNLSLNKLRVFFMDKANSPRLYLDAMEMMGNQIEMGREVEHRSYKTRISRTQHVQGDPLLDCSVYTLENSYHACIKTEIHKLFSEELGCQPPLFTEDLGSMCNQKFNVSAKKRRKIKALFLRLHYDDWKSKCKIPCTKNKYTTGILIKSSYSHPQLSIIFDKTVDVTHLTFSVDKQTFLTKLVNEF